MRNQSYVLLDVGFDLALLFAMRVSPALRAARLRLPGA
jgi:hypothetical protein